MKATNDANGLIFKDEVYDIKKQAARHSYQGIETILKALETAKIRISAKVNLDLVVELLLLTIKENSNDKSCRSTIPAGRKDLLL